MLCHISLKYVQKPSQRNKPAKVQTYNGKIKCFIRKRALILLFTYIYRHWKANLTEVMIVEFNQGQRGLAGSRIFLHLPISTLWWKLCSQLCLWLWKSDFMSHNFKPPPHLVYKMKMQIFSLVVWLASFSCCSAVSDSVIPWTGAHQAPLSLEVSRQEYWSGLSFPSPGHLPDPEIEPGSPALQADSLPCQPPGRSLVVWFKWSQILESR